MLLVDSTKGCASSSKDPVVFTGSTSTPRSPSPERNIVLNKPVTIPTEKVETPAVR